MGVYHLMGLGRSPGAVAAAISYLAARYERWDECDARFFATSGEFDQQGKRGDVQALVLFTTAEVIAGKPEGRCADYIDNPCGQSRGKCGHDDPVPRLLKRAMKSDLCRLGGGRADIPLFWCEIDLTDPFLTFARVAEVMHAAKRTGRVGKEIWINLTGGSNVVNLALQLSAALLGHPARIYYLLAGDTRCLRHTVPAAELGTERDGFWVEIPALYMSLDASAAAILELIEREDRPLPDEELLAKLRNHPARWADFAALDLPALRRAYLLPMSANQLIARPEKHVVTAGREWATLKRYYQVVAGLREPESTGEAGLEQLAASRPWLHADSV